VTVRRCKVFLVGEGSSDIGSLERIPQYRTSGRHGPGFLQPLIERIVGDDVALEFDGQKYSTILVKDLSDPDLIQGRRARAALAIAGITAGAKALVYLVDTDKEQGEAASDQEARRLHDALRASIEEGFERARRDDPPLGDVRTVTGVPLRMLEAWALGDPAAITAAGGDASKVPPRPETLWGAKRNPSSNYPKHALARALGASPSDGTDADTFATLAAHADPDVIARSCPVSFGPFLADVRAALAGCAAANESDDATAPTQPPKRSPRGRKRG